jgi:hypothetical protein
MGLEIRNQNRVLYDLEFNMSYLRLTSSKAANRRFELTLHMPV